MDIGQRRTFSIIQVCDKLGVSRRTVYNWINAGKVEYVRTPGGKIQIFADSLWQQDPDVAPEYSTSPTGPDSDAA